MTPDAIAKLLVEHFPTVDWESGYAWCACGFNLDFPTRESDWAEHVGPLIAVGHAH